MEQGENTNSQQLKESDENDIKTAFSDVIMGKRKAEMKQKSAKKTKFIDEEHYVPHLAPDRHTESG